MCYLFYLNSCHLAYTVFNTMLSFIGLCCLNCLMIINSRLKPHVHVSPCFANEAFLLTYYINMKTWTPSLKNLEHGFNRDIWYRWCFSTPATHVVYLLLMRTTATAADVGISMLFFFRCHNPSACVLLHFSVCYHLNYLRQRWYYWKCFVTAHIFWLDALTVDIVGAISKI